MEKTTGFTTTNGTFQSYKHSVTVNLVIMATVKVDFK